MDEIKDIPGSFLYSLVDQVKVSFLMALATMSFMATFFRKRC
ncbi:MAG: hypothetical protein ACUVRY_04585 [Thermoanaerobaculaceae bacterium]